MPRVVRLFAAVFLCILLEVRGDQESKPSVPVISNIPDSVYLAEQFASTSDPPSWIKSKAKKDENSDDEIARYSGQWSFEVPERSAFADDYGMVAKSAAKHHAIARNLREDFVFSERRNLVVQYEVRFQNSHDCGGAYVKLLSAQTPLELFNDATPYTIMFGPDKCGNSHKLHMIIKFKNPKTGEITEHHALNASNIPENVFTDTLTHLFRLKIDSNDDFITFVDNERIQSGNLKQDLEPSVIPAETVDDESDSKPDHWDDTRCGERGRGEYIADVNAKKPDDWDEDQPLQIRDPNAKKPDDWLEDEPAFVPDESAIPPQDYDEEIDGKWEAPKVPNPKCKDAAGCGKWEAPLIDNEKYVGKWSAPMVHNPEYKGVWKPRQIVNPAYFDLKSSVFENLAPISALGLELWTMSSDIVFDDFVVVSEVDSDSLPKRFANELWKVKFEADKSTAVQSASTVERLTDQAAKRPWLAATVVVGIFVAFVLVISYFTTGRSSSGKKKQEDVHHKKTDEKTPADDEAENNSEEHEDVEEESPDNCSDEDSGRPVKRSKPRRDE